MGSKSSKMLGLLSTGCFNAVKPQGNSQRSPNASAVPDHPWPTFGVPESSHPAALRRHGSLRRAAAKPTMLVCDGGCGRCGAGFNQDVFDGMAMKGNQDSANEKTVADVKDSRRDRLKLALRENLKRRKSQARGRGEASASSETDDASLDTASRKP
jgi:hypothetical protein